MATQNQYVNKTINCEGGLDLVTPKLLTAPGSLTDCLNFEVGIRNGYTRISGYDRFDGSASPADVYVSLAEIRVLAHPFPATSAGTPVYAADGTSLIGFFTDFTGSYSGIGETGLGVCVTDYEKLTSATQITVSTVLYDVQKISSALNVERLSSWTAADEVDYLQTQYNSLRNTVKPLPCGNWYKGANKTDLSPAIGLELFKDNIYAVQDLNKIFFTTGAQQVYAGDTIQSSTGQNITVRKVVVTSGTWGAGTAAGYFLVGPGDFATGTGKIVKPTSTVSSAFVATSTPVTVSEPLAGLFKSDINSWQFVETGYNFSYDSGANAPNKLDRGEVTQTNVLKGSTSKLVCGAAAGPSGSPAPYSWQITGWGGGTATAVLHEALDDYKDTTEPHTDTKYAYLSIASSPVDGRFESNNGIRTITLSSYTTGIPSDATITGIEIGVRGGVLLNFLNSTSDAAFDAAGFTMQVQPNISGKTSTYAYAPIYRTDSGDLKVFGGDGEMFDMADLTPTDVAGITLDISIKKANAVRIYATDGVAYNLQVPWLDYVYLKVYWTQKVSKYYFWNGSDDVSAQIVDYWVESGDWDSANVKGRMQIYSNDVPSSVYPEGTSNRRTIKNGDEIRSSPSGGGILIGKVTSDMTYSGLPALSELESNSSRYQTIVANFYGNKDWEAIYGCSGAGRAFAYDGYYLRYIYTGLSDDLDKPRHVAFHQHSLALGFNSGNLALSVVGQPTNYSGLDGAVTFDLGDGIVGLVRMNGTTLGCYCTKSIHGLVGSSVNDYSAMILNPYEGAIEYTVVDVGGKPIHCSARGISVFEQTNAYGDFLGNRLSTLVTPWLLPRLQKEVPPSDSSTSNPFATTPSLNPVVAIPVRSKNQYQVYFADGYRLTMTLVGLELKPQFTIQKLFSYNDSQVYAGPFIPRAECSSNYSNGQEIVVMSRAWNTVISTTSGGDTLGNLLGYVFRMEKGWTFDGVGIWGYVDINDNFLASEYENDVIRKERVYGLSYGYFPLKSMVANDYTSLDFNSSSVATASPVSLPREDLVPTHLYTQYKPVTNICNTAKEGRSFSIRYYVPNDTDTSDSTKALHVAPPGVIQALLIQHSNTKADV